jgi:hypothetical protein
MQLLNILSLLVVVEVVVEMEVVDQEQEAIGQLLDFQCRLPHILFRLEVVGQAVALALVLRVKILFFLPLHPLEVAPVVLVLEQVQVKTYREVQVEDRERYHRQLLELLLLVKEMLVLLCQVVLHMELAQVVGQVLLVELLLIQRQELVELVRHLQ